MLAPKWYAEAKERTRQLSPVIRELQQHGLSMRAVAAELTKRKVPTPKGGKWHPTLVSRMPWLIRTAENRWRRWRVVEDLVTEPLWI